MCFYTRICNHLVVAKRLQNMIFWINSPFDPLPLDGGRPMRYELLARALVKQGHDVVWWSSDFHHLRKHKRQLEPVYDCDGYEVRLVPTFPYSSNVSLRRLWSHRRYAEDWRQLASDALSAGELKPPGIIILSMPPLGLFDQAAKFRSEYGCKVIVDIQDAWPENFVNLVPAYIRPLVGLSLFALKKAAERAYRGADVITAVAGKYLSLAESYGAACPSKVFPLGAMLPDISGCAERSEEKLRLVYVGNLGPSYDLKTMLDAVVDLVREGVELTLDIAGDGPRKREVEEAVKVSGGTIRFHGYLAEEELSQLLKACDVGIIPMKDEMMVAVPNKLVDYAAHGLTVVNGLSSETNDLLEEFECGFLYETGSVESFKVALKRYCENSSLLKKHKVNARHMAEEKFDALKSSSEMANYCDHTVVAMARVKG